MPDLLERANDDENTASVFADSRTESLTVYPSGPCAHRSWGQEVVAGDRSGKTYCSKAIIELHPSLSGGLR